MTATVVTRPPLGLPAGSIRAILAVQITAIFWILLLSPTQHEIPLNLYFLLAMVMMFFVAHGKSIARRSEPEASPLWLPGGTIRFLILAGTAAILIYIGLKMPERLDRLTPEAGQLPNWKYYLSALAIGFVLGYGTRVFPFRHSWIFQTFQAWSAIVAMAIMFLHMALEVIINRSMESPIDPVSWQAAVTGIVAFYYGSRS
jgi:hypothetical protein